MSAAAEASRDFWSWYGRRSAPVAPETALSATETDFEPVYVFGSGAARRKPSGALRARLLSKQMNRCLYCDCRFGQAVHRSGGRRGGWVQLRLNWDHFIPYAYSGANPQDNWVAACHICNGIKGPRMFDTVREASEWILARWVEKGIDRHSRPMVD